MSARCSMRRIERRLSHARSSRAATSRPSSRSRSSAHSETHRATGRAMGRDLSGQHLVGRPVLVGDSACAATISCWLADASAHRAGLRGAGQSPGSAARHDAVRPARTADVGRAAVFCPRLRHRLRRLARASFSYLPLAGALALSVALIVFGSRPDRQQRQGQSRTRCSQWSSSGCCWRCSSPDTSRSDGICCDRFADDTCARSHVPAWLNVPRADYVLPVSRRRRLALLFFFLQKDLGPALFLSCVFLLNVRDRAQSRRSRDCRIRAARCRLLHRLRPQHLLDADRRECRCGSRCGTTALAAASRLRRRSGASRPAASLEPASVSATRVTCRRATPT